MKFRTAFLSIAAFVFCGFHAGWCAETPAVALKAAWSGNFKVVKYNGREFITGVRNGAEKDFPMIGTRTLAAPAYANSASPMTIQSQDSYVIYDKTKQKLIVYNIALCLKGKDEGNSEKTDWVGKITPSQDHWAGDIIYLRRYDKKGPGMKAPYYSMGRDYPIFVGSNGDCDIDYDYFGRLHLKLAAREVKDDVLQKIIEDFDTKYKERDTDNR